MARHLLYAEIVVAHLNANFFPDPYAVGLDFPTDSFLRWSTADTCFLCADAVRSAACAPTGRPSVGNTLGLPLGVGLELRLAIAKYNTQLPRRASCARRGKVLSGQELVD